MKAMTGCVMGECGMIDKALDDNTEGIGGFEHESCHSRD
jgi:hypothetical protein